MDNKIIMVADSDPSDLKFLKTCFVSAGYQVLQASNGNQAFEQAMQLPDLIILNTMLPVMSGFKVCQQLKRHVKTTDIPVIFVPESHGDDTILKCFEAGGDDYILKPFQEQALLHRARIRLNLKGRENHYRQIVEKASDVIYCTDSAGRFNYVNPFTERLLGFSREEIIGKNFLEFIRPDFAIKVKKFHQHQVKEKVEKLYTEIPVMTKGRKHLWLAQHSQLLMHKEKVIGFQAIARDISQTRRLEKDLRSVANELEMTNRQLIQANDNASEMAAKAEFANMAGNELLDSLRVKFDTYLGDVGGVISRLADTALSDVQRQDVETIRSACDHLLNLIHDSMGGAPK